MHGKLQNFLVDSFRDVQGMRPLHTGFNEVTERILLAVVSHVELNNDLQNNHMEEEIATVNSKPFQTQPLITGLDNAMFLPLWNTVLDSLDHADARELITVTAVIDDPISHLYREIGLDAHGKVVAANV